MDDEYIRLDTTIIAIDNLINEAATGTMARTLFKAKDTLYSQQRYVIDVQPVKRGRWITKAEDYYKAWQDSGRSWDYMPYFVTGKHIACSECFIEYDVCTEGIEHWTGCPCCLARMDGEQDD
jgi:hypothetical protein